MSQHRKQLKLSSDRKKKLALWTKIKRLLAVFTTLLAGLLAFSNLNEFYRIAVLKKINSYPFEKKAPVPWNFESAELYSRVCLIFGVLFFLVFCFSLLAISKKPVVRVLISFILILIIVLIQILNKHADK